MRVPQNRGGLGISDLPLYYEAAQLTSILRVLKSPVEADWMCMEFLNHKNLTKYDIIWGPRNNRPTETTGNAFCAMTLKIWGKWKPKLIRKFSPAMPLINMG